uniref:Zgc:158343 n=1 Tax=Seriola dumerili TaxID=41447 RepID=A0A3B4UWL6_SERDU
MCKMYSRSNSVTLTVQQESFGFSRMATRSTQPEVFTFERIPAQATAVRSYVPIRPKKRCTRVMYPAKVRMHLPPPEKSQAKRWLVILCMVVLWQIYTEEPCADTPLSSAESPIGDYQGFAFQSAEDTSSDLPTELTTVFSDMSVDLVSWRCMSKIYNQLTVLFLFMAPARLDSTRLDSTRLDATCSKFQ